MEIAAVWTGFRPTSDDDAPILGATGVAGLMLATGHHRNGILLSGLTGELVAGVLAGEGLPDWAAAADAGRFARAEVTA